MSPPATTRRQHDRLLSAYLRSVTEANAGFQLVKFAWNSVAIPRSLFHESFEAFIPYLGIGPRIISASPISLAKSEPLLAKGSLFKVRCLVYLT